MIDHPVLRREVMGLLRNPWSSGFPMVTAIVSSMLVLFRWPSDGQADLAGSQAQNVFRLFGYGFLTFILVLLPAFPSTSIVRERVSGTLALLLNSPLSAWSIHLGKVSGSLLLVVVVFLASLPAAASCYVLGGVSVTRQILPLYAILLLFALEVIVLGLLVSAYSSSTDSAIRWTYCLLLVVVVLSQGPAYFLRGSPVGWKKTTSQAVRSLSPLPSIMDLTGQGELTSGGILSQDNDIRNFVQLSLGVNLLAMLMTILRLKPTLFDRPRNVGQMTDDRQFSYKLWRRIFFLVDPQRRSGLIGPYTNPVMVKEFRCRQFGRSHWVFRLLAACAITSLGLTYVSTNQTLDWGVETIGGIMILLQFSLICILVPCLGAIMISGERESGSWTLLQMTPLSPPQIIVGKLLSASWMLAIILLATLPGYLVMIVIRPELKQQISYVLFTLLLMGVVALLLSAAVSSLFVRTAPATVTSYCLLTFVWGGSLLLWLGRGSMFSHGTLERVLTINPLATALSLSRTPGFSSYQLVPYNWWLMIGIAVISACVLWYRTRKLSRPE
ncbi:MAG: ABC transporter [Planctomycetes bacterium]|nr:ABC transporter [Planctomycetota bacterium]